MADSDPGVPPAKGRAGGGSGSLSAGTVFAERYEIRSLLGSGGAGEVYRSFDRLAGVEVALKVMFPRLAERDLERLRRQLRIVRTMRHPGILRVFDLGESEGRLYTVSEILEGETLATRILREGRLPPAEAERVVRAILEALAEAHDAGVIHRDIKPGNVFLETAATRDAERVVLLDFGLARQAEDPALTRTGTFVGTPAYCSPEQIRGDRALTPATDLYSCGITLWEMLAGRPPFVADSEIEVIEAHLNAALPAFWRALPGVPAHLRHVARRLLEKSPDRRPADAREALRLLEHRGLVGSLGVRLAEIRAAAGRSTRSWRWLGSSAAVAAALLLCAWLAVPVAVRSDGQRIAWRTRAGFELLSRPFDAPVCAAALAPRPGLLAGRAVVCLSPVDPDAAPLRRVRDLPPFLLDVGFPFDRRYPLCEVSTQRSILEGAFYHDQNPVLRPRRLLLTPPSDRTSEPFVVLGASDPVNYPSRLAILATAEGACSTYDHPGHVTSLQAADFGDGSPRLAVAGAINNLLGPRVAAFALPLTHAASAGQAPPYTGSVKWHESAAWYLPLPFRAPGAIAIRIVGGATAIAELDGRTRIRFDVAAGIPLDEADRGGLSPQAWGARRDRLLAALFEASGRAESGNPAAGAEVLERLAGDGKGSPPLRSIPLYRAARLRMEASDRGGRPEMERALADVSAAFAIEPDPPRYGLLHAEILARLGRREESRAALEGWWSRPAQSMYSYEWILVSWLAGSEPPGDLVASPRSSEWDPGWVGLERITAALHRSDFRDAVAAAVPAGERRPVWDQQLYFSARAYLEEPDPDVRSALRALERARSGLRTGVHVPVDLAILRARLDQDAATPLGEADVHAAVDDCVEVARDANRDVEALFLLPWAVRDIERILAVRPDLRELEAAGDRARDVIARWMSVPASRGPEARLPRPRESGIMRPGSPVRAN